MTNQDFEKNLMITYLDEVKWHDFGDYCFDAIVSISMNINYYINNIEVKWIELRKKYGIPEGVCLHFTDIKALLNPTYFSREGKDRNENIEKVFCNDNTVDKEKLYNFYIDIVKFIQEIDIDILVTGVKQHKDENSKINKTKLKPIWRTLFIAHLDNLAYYLTFKDDKNNKPYSTKLIFDGDKDFGAKYDIKYGYGNIIYNGTSRFRARHCIECFDNLKFVGKEKVGFYDKIAHSGNEILDFIALYAGRYYFKDQMIKYYMEYNEVDKEKAEEYFEKKTKIYIDEYEIYPNEVIEKKIYKNI